MWYVRDVLVNCFVVRGCGVSRRYIDVCYCDMFSVVNVYLDHLKLCVLIVEGMSVAVNVMLSLMSLMSLSVRTADPFHSLDNLKSQSASVSFCRSLRSLQWPERSHTVLSYA